MNHKQKDIIKVVDKKIIKILNRPFTKRILECFNNEAKSAGQIANSISFPKDKIYYHIKKLLANKILYVDSIDKVKGIEQKFFLPTAKIFDTNIQKEKIKTIPNTNTQEKKDVEHEQLKNIEKEIITQSGIDIKRKINDRRRKNERRFENRRNSKTRRKKSITDYNGKENRILKKRRHKSDQRFKPSRRAILDRRFTKSFKSKKTIEKKNKKSLKIQSVRYKNLLLKLNGIKNAITFVHSGKNVTFLLCKMNQSGFEIERINNYVLPFKGKDHTISTLPELIINVSNQFIKSENKEKVYLAIHSENYHCEMTYVSAKGKNKNLFRKDLLNTLSSSYDINHDHNIFDFISYSRHEKNAAVCISNKRSQIKKDYKDLAKEGLNIRYNTSMPQILNNIFTYYNLHHDQDYTLLIYIDRQKSHLVFSKSGQLFESKEINKGLQYFSDALSELSVNSNEENARENSLHYLSYQGFSKKSSDLTIEDGIPIKKANAILEHLMNSFLDEVKEAIFYFEKVLLHDGYSEQVINKAFTCGVGSHMNNLDNILSDKLRIDVSNLSDYNSSFMRQSRIKKAPVFTKIRNSGLFKKKHGTEAHLKSIKKRIHDHENAIETASRPESAKYRLTRLEMEKDSKLKSIESANKKLLNASKEFKHIKDEYLNGQEALKEDLNSISVLIEDKSHILIDRYKEHENVGKKISELEYAIDQSKNHKVQEKQERKGRYQLRVKHAVQSRAKVSDNKESLDQEIDGLELTILKLEEALHKINKKIENGNDEISVFEYLKESIQATANAFKRSFIEHLKSLENLTQEDLNNLQRSEYLLTQNTKRIDEIKESFSSIVSGDSKFDNGNLIDNDNGKEIRKKLLKILSLVIEAPDNLIHLKNLTGSIIKINESQSDMMNKISEIGNQKREAKRSISGNKKKLISLNKDIKTNEIELDKKVNRRQEKIEILNYVREAIEWIHDLDNHMVILKELKPQRQLQKNEINDISDRISRLNSLKISCQNSLDELELEQAGLKHSVDKEKKNINEATKALTDKEEVSKKELDLIKENRDTIKDKISNAMIYIEQLEKQVVVKNNDIETFNLEAKPIFEAFEVEKDKLIKEYDPKIRFYDIEYDKKIIEAKKTKEKTLDAYFKKEVVELRKKQKSIEKSIIKTKKERDKAKLDKEKANASLLKIKKKNQPNILQFSIDIKSWEKDLTQGRRFQERLDALDAKKREWDDHLEQERQRITDQIKILQHSIDRKKSNSYRLFLKNGLNRFQKNGDSEKIAITMAEDSISMDMEEVNQLDQELEKFMSQYDYFMVRYRKSQRDILTKLRPFGGRKKNILEKIKKAKARIHNLESMIKKWVDKVDDMNELLIKKQDDFVDARESGKIDQASIKSEIKNMPYKKDRAQSEVEQRLKNRLHEISDKKRSLEKDKKEALFAIYKVFKKEQLIKKIDEAEERMIFFLNEIESTKEKIESLKEDERSSLRSSGLLESNLEKIFKKHDLNQTVIVKIDEEFKKDNSKFVDRINSHQAELSILEQQLLSLHQQKDEKMSYLEKIEVDYNRENDAINKLKKDIKIFDENYQARIDDENKGKKQTTRKEKIRYLLQMEKDMVIDLDRLETMIKELNILIDTMQNERSGLESSISLMKNDINYYESDLSRIKTLIENNKAHIIKISTNHRSALNGISNVKELYTPSKIMLNERITELYTHLELKTRDRDDLKIRLEEIHEDLKNKRVEAAMLEQNLKNINDDMKNALENSFYENEDTDSDLKWDLPENKINSYMDLAQLKVQSKRLSKSIADKEEDIAKLKNQLSSINNVLVEKEKIGHKKITMMEETCTRLELQITKEKNELNGLEQEVKQLTGFAFNYGDRIDILEKELKDFREKQTEYEIVLKDLDRALESIEDKAHNEIKDQSPSRGNSIQIDYMANLGLLMDPNLRLNLIPKTHKRDFKYYRPNQVLQNVVLVLITVFSLGSLFQRSKIAKLDTILPLKKSELSLLDMRQEMKEVVSNKNMIANAFSTMIKDDKVASINMVSMLKYFSSTIPNNFKVTNLNIEKLGLLDSFDYEKFEYSDLVMTVDGFFDQDQSKAPAYMEKLKKKISKDNQFKSIKVVKDNKSKDNRIIYTMKIVR